MTGALSMTVEADDVALRCPDCGLIAALWIDVGPTPTLQNLLLEATAHKCPEDS